MIKGPIRKGDRLKGPTHVSERVVIGFVTPSDGYRRIICEYEARKWDGTPTGQIGVEVESEWIAREFWSRVA